MQSTLFHPIFKTYFNIIPRNIGSSKLCPSSTFTCQNTASIFPHFACNMPRPSYLPSCHHPNSGWQGMQILKLLVTPFSPHLWDLLPFGIHIFLSTLFSNTLSIYPSINDKLLNQNNNNNNNNNMNPTCTNSKPKLHHELGKMMVTGKTIDYRKLQKILHDIEVVISLVKSEVYQEEIRKYRTSKTKITRTV